MLYDNQMTNVFLALFFVGFFLNLLYELLHSLLYKTCWEADLKKYVYLILKAALFDGFSIAVMYFLIFTVFARNQFLIFTVVSLVFAFAWEVYSVKAGKWEYTKTMPKILGVGLTPLVQLAITGLLSIYITSHFFV